MTITDWNFDYDLSGAFNEPTTMQAAANWNPALHPRGRDGRWIEIGSLIRWFLGADRHDGMVTGISEATGDLRVRDHDGSVRIVEPRDVLEVNMPKAHIADDDVVLYHGTSKEEADDILRSGLNNTWDGNYTLTPSFSAAKEYSYNGRSEEEGGAVLEVRLPAAVAKDYLETAGDPSVPDEVERTDGSAWLRQTIPTEYISRVDESVVLPTVIEPAPTTIDTNVDRSVESTDYLYGDMEWTSPTPDIPDAWETAYSLWSGYDGNYDMRQVSAALMGDAAPPSYGNEVGPEEVHHIVETGVSEGQPEWAVEQAHEAVESGYIGMKAVLYGEKAEHDSWRGISDVSSGSPVLQLEAGDEFTMPLSAFTPIKKNAESFAVRDPSSRTASVVMKLKRGAKVAPAPAGYNSEEFLGGDWVEVTAEYVTQGQFRVTGTHQEPNLAGIGQTATVIELEQIGVYDPDVNRMSSTEPRRPTVLATPAIPSWVMTEMGQSWPKEWSVSIDGEPTDVKTGVYDGVSEMNIREATDALRELFPRTAWVDEPLTVDLPDGTTRTTGGLGPRERIYGLEYLTPRERAAYVQTAQYMVEHYPGVADIVSLNIINEPIWVPAKGGGMDGVLGATSIRAVGPNYDFRHGVDVSLSASQIRDATGADGKMHQPDSPTTGRGVTDPAEFVSVTMIHEFAHAAHYHATAEWYRTDFYPQLEELHEMVPVEDKSIDWAYDELNSPESGFGRMIRDDFDPAMTAGIHGLDGPLHGLRHLWRVERANAAVQSKANDAEAYAKPQFNLHDVDKRFGDPTVYAMTNPAEFFAEMLTAETIGLPIPNQEAFDALVAEAAATAVLAAGYPELDMDEGETESAIWIEGQGWTTVDPGYLPVVSEPITAAWDPRMRSLLAASLGHSTEVDDIDEDEKARLKMAAYKLMIAIADAQDPGFPLYRPLTSSSAGTLVIGDQIDEPLGVAMTAAVSEVSLRFPDATRALPLSDDEYLVSGRFVVRKISRTDDGVIVDLGVADPTITAAGNVVRYFPDE